LKRQQRCRRRAVAEQSLGAIRTVKQCGGEKLAATRYAAALAVARAASVRGGALAGCGFGAMTGTINAFFGLALWFGAWLVARGAPGGRGSGDGKLAGGDVVAVLFAQILGAMALGQMQPALAAVLQVRDRRRGGAAARWLLARPARWRWPSGVGRWASAAAEPAGGEGHEQGETPPSGRGGLYGTGQG
jgi:ABC-type multidrug transport system fused ATPase/permease subunit